MMPEFAPRHRPQLFISRVSAKRPLVALNPPDVLVDANFSTLWLRRDATITVNALFSLLSSTVAGLLYEHAGSVMGGGALKIEATHLRAMPLPRLTRPVRLMLDRLGGELASCAPNQRGAIIK